VGRVHDNKNKDKVQVISIDVDGCLYKVDFSFIILLLFL
jgi:hypothetical protein